TAGDGIRSCGRRCWMATTGCANAHWATCCRYPSGAKSANACRPIRMMACAPRRRSSWQPESAPVELLEMAIERGEKALAIRRRRRIAAELLLRRTQELVVGIERVLAHEFALSAARAVLPLVAGRADVEEPGRRRGELLRIVGVLPAG